MIPNEAIAVREPQQFQQTPSSIDVRGGASESLQYMPQLDGLRALAVGAVVLEHYGITESGAGYGVHLFFVLSGFLISGILMRSRAAIDIGRQNWKEALRRFYIRRVLRIFPLYYAVVFIGIIVNAGYARDYAPWLLTYTINIKMAAQGWYIDNFAHLWSLAVEEQYYLIWPLLILLVPRRWLVTSAVIMTAAGPLFRLALMANWRYLHSDMSGLTAYIATPATFDSLGMGSLIAIMMATESGRTRIRRWMRFAIPLIGVLLGIVVVYTGWWILTDTATALVFGWLIYRASSGFGGVGGRLLSAPPLIFVGRISYGVYVYHELVSAVARSLAADFNLPVPRAAWLKIVFIGVTLAVSTVSWYYFERPIKNLNRYFD